MRRKTTVFPVGALVLQACLPRRLIQATRGHGTQRRPPKRCVPPAFLHFRPPPFGPPSDGNPCVFRAALVFRGCRSTIRPLKTFRAPGVLHFRPMHFGGPMRRKNLRFSNRGTGFAGVPSQALDPGHPRARPTTKATQTVRAPGVLHFRPPPFGPPSDGNPCVLSNGASFTMMPPTPNIHNQAAQNRPCPRCPAFWAVTFSGPRATENLRFSC